MISQGDSSISLQTSLISAAEATVQAILACQVSDANQSSLVSVFGSVASVRICFTSIAGNKVLLSSNLLRRGEVLFTPVDDSNSCAAQVADECKPTFLDGNSVAVFSDLRVVTNQDSCAAFFCVPLPNDPGSESLSASSSAPPETSCLGALFVGFDRESTVEEHHLRAALMLARQISANHQPALQSLLSSVSPLLNPEQREHPRWGDAGGLLRLTPDSQLRRRIINRPSAAANGVNGGEIHDGASEYSSDEDQGNEDGHRGLVINPVQHQLLDNADKWTLVFPDKELEAKYGEWRGIRMAKVDIAALITLLAYHATRSATVVVPRSTPPPPAATSIPSLLLSKLGMLQTMFHEAAPARTRVVFTYLEWLPCVILALPLLLIFLPATHRWYTKQRDCIIALVYIFLAWHHAVHDAQGGTKVFTATENAFENIWQILSNLEGIWIAILSIILHVQHPWQGVMLVGAALASASMGLPQCPDALSLAICRGATLVRIAVANVLAPAALLYVLEYAARKAFCATPLVAEYSWRREVQTR